MYISYSEKINFLTKGLQKENWCFGLEDKNEVMCKSNIVAFLGLGQ